MAQGFPFVLEKGQSQTVVIRYFLRMRRGTYRFSHEEDKVSIETIDDRWVWPWTR